MTIRKARLSDWEDLLEIYARARQFMKDTGNPNQWRDTNPTNDTILRDIALGHAHVCEIDGRIQCVFAFLPGEDPTYRVIQGAWLSDAPYCAVHRVASRGEVPGIASQCLQWCLAQCGNVRIDTHDDNRPMQRVLEKNGFTYCGRIRLENGDPRIAYQKIIC